MFRNLFSAQDRQQDQRVTEGDQHRSRLSLNTLEDRCVPAILVTTLADEMTDNGRTSLREAIEIAAINPGDDTITFSRKLSGSIDLTLGQLSLQGKGGITIQGTRRVDTIDAGGASRVLEVSSVTQVNLRNLTLTGGASDKEGGGIFNAGDLSLYGVRVQGNSATSGGGIFNEGEISLFNSQVRNNQATSAGGGIRNQAGGTAELLFTTVSGNTSDGTGGGISNLGMLNLNWSEVNANSASIAGGGGIFSTSVNNSASVVLNNSRVLNNSAVGEGGGILFASSTVEVNDSIISGNTATVNGGGIQVGVRGNLTMNRSIVSNNSATNGGGLFLSFAAKADVNASSILSNTASENGGGIFTRANNFFGPVELSVSSSLVALNSAGQNGGGIYSQGNTSILGTFMVGNQAETNGGGLYVANGVSSVMSSAFLWNNTTQEPKLGTAIYSASAGKLELDDATGFVGPGDLIFIEEPMLG